MKKSKIRCYVRKDGSIHLTTIGHLKHLVSISTPLLSERDDFKTEQNTDKQSAIIR